MLHILVFEVPDDLDGKIASALADVSHDVGRRFGSSVQSWYAIGGNPAMTRDAMLAAEEEA